MADELKKAIEAAGIDAEKKTTVKWFGEELLCLNDEELDNVAGGVGAGGYTYLCRKCRYTVKEMYMEKDEEGNLIHKGCGGIVDAWRNEGI